MSTNKGRKAKQIHTPKIMESKCTHWSAENATKAYLKTIKMDVVRPKEPDESEFISAIAAGNNAQLIVVACGEAVQLSTLLALLAAAHQTLGRVVCIFRNLNKLLSTKQALSQDANSIEFIIGDAQRLILEDYKAADFVINDCKLGNHETLLRAMQSSGEFNGAIVLGCNAFSTTSWQRAGLKTQLLPIGEGLLVTRITCANDRQCSDGVNGRKSHWIVKVDKYTGEEHVFRVRSPSSKKLGE